MTCEVVEISGAAVGPGDDVVGVEVGRRVAAGELTDTSVPDLQRATLRTGRETFRTTKAEHLSSARDQYGLHLRCTQRPFGGRRLDRAVALYVAGARVDGRSRGNVCGSQTRRSRGNVQCLGVDVDHDQRVVVGRLTWQRLQVGGGHVDQGRDPIPFAAAGAVARRRAWTYHGG